MSSVPVYPGHCSSSHPVTNNLSTDMPLSIQGGRTLSFFMFAYMPGVEGADYSSHISGSPVISKEVMIDDTSTVSQPASI